MNDGSDRVVTYLVDVALGLVVAGQVWLLRTVWNTKLSRDEARRMFEEFEQRDAVRDEAQIKAVTAQLARLTADLHSEHNENVGRLDRLDGKIDSIRDILTVRRGGH